MTPQVNEGSAQSNGVLYVLALFITGQSARSQRAVANLRSLCDLLGENCELTVIDVLERPQAAEDERILATPTVIRRRPLPLRRVIGDLSDPDKVIAWLDLPTPANQRTPLPVAEGLING